MPRLFAPSRVHTEALDFPSGNDGHVELLDSTTVAKYGTGDSAGTIACLVQAANTISARALRLNNSSTNTKQIFVPSVGDISFSVNKTTSDTEVRTSLSTMGIAAGEWVWLVYVFDTAGADTDQKLYYCRPGEAPREPSSYVTQTAGSGSIITDSGHTLYLGNRWGGTGPWGKPIAWFAWAEVEWTQDQIAAFTRNPWRGGPQMLFNIPFGGTGQQIDISGNANHAKLATTATDYPVPAPGIPLIESNKSIKLYPPNVDRSFKVWRHQPPAILRSRGHSKGGQFGAWWSDDADFHLGNFTDLSMLFLLRIGDTTGQTDVGLIMRFNGTPNNTFASSLSYGGGVYADKTFGITVRRATSFLQIGAKTSTLAGWDRGPGLWNWVLIRGKTGGSNSDQQVWGAPLRGALTEATSYTNQSTGAGALDDPHTKDTEIWSQWSGAGPENFPGHAAFLGWWDRYLSIDEAQQFILTGRVPYHNAGGAVFMDGAPRTGPLVDYRGLAAFERDSGSAPDDETQGPPVILPWNRQSIYGQTEVTTYYITPSGALSTVTGGLDPAKVSIARPDAILTQGSWQGSYTDIDEIISNSADFMQSTGIGGDTVEIGLGSLADPSTQVNHTLDFTYVKQGSDTINLVMELYAGTTLIKTITRNGITTTVTRISEELSSAEVTSFRTNGGYSDARLQVTATKV